ncbi:MAG: class I SAM-dependent methyltransferase [Thermoplasmata archaeon]|nr:class I SAM-dependent methyltransferase [Thermoplasmata archaeon]
MPAHEERYSIRGGKEGYERLLLLARDRWEDTHSLLQRSGLAGGMRCLDVGCGGGEVSLQIAKLVAPDGTVVGIDMDPVKLDLARHEATERGIGNVEFRETNANVWNEPSAYDVVYSRFLLHHLRDPVDLLRRMWAAVRPGGSIVVEDADHEGWCSDPPDAAFRFQVRMLCEVIRAGGGDPTLGRKLPRFFREAGISEPQFTVVQPAHRGSVRYSLPVSTLEATRESILASGLATPEEIATALEQLTKFTSDPNSMISGPRIFQLRSRRETAPTPG